jgi:hypothetical protein
MATRSGRVNPGLRAVKEIFMKSVEEQLEIERQKYIADQTKKGFNEGAILTCWKESVMTGASVEEKLSKAKKLTSNIAESDRPTRVRRNNGASVEGSVEERDQNRIQKYMKLGMTIRESHIMAGLPDPGPNAKQPAAFTESLVKAWKRYARISESDARQLAEKGISPE